MTWTTTFENAHHRLNRTSRTNSKFGIWSLRRRDPDVVVEPDEVGRDRVVDPEVLGPEVGERHPDLEDQRVERDDRHHGERGHAGRGRATARRRQLFPWRGDRCAPRPSWPSLDAPPPGDGRSGRSGYGQRIGPGPGSARRWSAGRGRSGGAARAPPVVARAEGYLPFASFMVLQAVATAAVGIGALVEDLVERVAEGAPVVVELGALRPGEARRPRRRRSPGRWGC